MTLRTETNPVREYQKQARDKNAADGCLRIETEKRCEQNINTYGYVLNSNIISIAFLLQNLALTFFSTYQIPVSKHEREPSSS